MSTKWDSENGESRSSSSSSGIDVGWRQRGPNWVARPRLCEHGVASLRTSQTPVNPMRRFYCCSRRGARDDCGLWEWVDPELTDHYKDCIARLKLGIVRAEEQLDEANKLDQSNRRVLGGRLTDYISTNVEIESLKAKNEELRNIARKQSMQLFTVKICFCILFVSLGFIWLLN